MPYTDQHWKRFFIEAGEPALAVDPRFTNISSRTDHIETLYETADRIIATRTTAQWLGVCSRLEIPASRMNRLEDLQGDEHLRATGFFQSIQDEAMGTLVFPGIPVRLDGRRLPVGMPPRLGEHTAQVLSELGIHVAPATAADPAGSGTTAAL